MTSNINNLNIAVFTDKTLDLNSIVITDRFEKISRWNILARIFNRSSLQSDHVCENIQKCFSAQIGNLSLQQKDQAIKNLEAASLKFFKTSNENKRTKCFLILSSVIDTLKKTTSETSNKSAKDETNKPHSHKDKKSKKPSVASTPKTIAPQVITPTALKPAPTNPFSSQKPKAPIQNTTPVPTAALNLKGAHLIKGQQKETQINALASVLHRQSTSTNTTRKRVETPVRDPAKMAEIEGRVVTDAERKLWNIDQIHTEIDPVTKKTQYYVTAIVTEGFETHYKKAYLTTAQIEQVISSCNNKVDLNANLFARMKAMGLATK